MVSSARLKAYALLTGTFVLGAVFAGAGYHAYALEKNAELFSGDREAFEARRVQVMTRELDLSPEQAQKVRAIFERHAPERQRLMREAMQSCGAAINAHRERIDEELRALLEPGQKSRFEALRVDRKKRWIGAPDASAKSP